MVVIGAGRYAPDAPQGEAAMSRVYDIADEFIERFAALNPLAATRLGVPGHDHEMSDLSPDGVEASAALSRDIQAQLEAAAVEGERDRVAREAMLEALELEFAVLDAGEPYRSLSILGSPLQGLRGVFDVMPRESDEQWSNIAARLQLVPEALAGYRLRLEEGLRRKLPPARRQVLECAKQCEVWSGQVEGTEPFFATLLTAYDTADVDSESLRTELEGGTLTATAAYREMGTWLRDRYLASANPADPVGADRYALGARAFNGTELDLDETYRWGWEELRRISAEMEQTAEQIAPGQGVQGARELLESDPERAIEGEEAFREWMQETQEATIAALDGVHFDIPQPVRTIETRIAPPGGALAMYYTGPSDDFSRPGRTWYPTGGKARFPLWSEVSVAYHEGVPGHHLQIAHTVYLREQLSRYQRLRGGTSGYVEGWALYAERLMGELGYLDNPDYYLGMLASQALRAARVVVDIGMHLELTIPDDERFHPGERWTPALGHELIARDGPFDERVVASEIDRYLGLPGQAISYKVGERHWREAREAARKREGDAFDLKAWHARAFDLGPMGLAQMRRELGGESA